MITVHFEVGMSKAEYRSFMHDVELLLEASEMKRCLGCDAWVKVSEMKLADLKGCEGEMLCKRHPRKEGV